MASMSLVPGKLVECDASGRRYTLVRKLGAGSFGLVWLCEEAESGERRAVKVLCAGAGDFTAVTDEVRKTLLALEAAGDDCVPRVYEASEGTVQLTDFIRVKAYIIVSEFIDGVDAATLADSCVLLESQCRIIVRDVLFALARLHKGGVIHRDIKGNNVIISTTGKTYLCDFGLSALASEEGALDESFGSPFFMAPEVCAHGIDDLRGFVGTYDEKVDIWSLGIMACQLALGRTPWDEPEKSPSGMFGGLLPSAFFTEDLFRRIVQEDVPSALESTGFSSDFQNLIGQCLERDPARRPAAEDLLKAKCMQVRPSQRADFQRWAQRVCSEDLCPAPARETAGELRAFGGGAYSMTAPSYAGF